MQTNEKEKQIDKTQPQKSNIKHKTMKYISSSIYLQLRNLPQKPAKHSFLQNSTSSTTNMT